jgi:hypothetical protein
MYLDDCIKRGSFGRYQQYDLLMNNSVSSILEIYGLSLSGRSPEYQCILGASVMDNIPARLKHVISSGHLDIVMLSSYYIFLLLKPACPHSRGRSFVGFVMFMSVLIYNVAKFGVSTSPVPL